MYKVVMHYSDGTSEEEDEIFETESEANNFGLEQLSNIATGAEVLHLSNPGDYPAHHRRQWIRGLNPPASSRHRAT